MSNDAAVVLEVRISTGSASGATGTASLLARTATGVVLLLAGNGDATREALSASGTTLAQPYIANGAPEFEQRTAAGTVGIHAIVLLEERSATGRARGAVTGSPSREAYIVNQTTGFVRLSARTATGVASAVVGATFLTLAMNTRNNAVTEYNAHEFNSYARIGNDYYGAGADGLVKLSGTTDDGVNIDWTVRTGQMDDGEPGLKRLPEILLALRNTGKIRVRVHQDDDTYYDYTMAVVKPDVIHQHRVVPGKGMRSRYFSVELQGIANSAMELDSMQVNMTKTTRRLG